MTVSRSHFHRVILIATGLAFGAMGCQRERKATIEGETANDYKAYIQGLLSQYDRESPDTNEAIFTLLVHEGDEAVPVLREVYLGDISSNEPYGSQNRCAAIALGRIGTKDSLAVLVDAIEYPLHKRNREPRVFAGWTLLAVMGMNAFIDHSEWSISEIRDFDGLQASYLSLIEHIQSEIKRGRPVYACSVLALAGVLRCDDCKPILEDIASGRHDRCAKIAKQTLENWNGKRGMEKGGAGKGVGPL